MGRRGILGGAEVGRVAWGGRMDGLGEANGMQHACIFMKEAQMGILPVL